ncbi:unnamed protein product [Candidula unifasciata]|uniref:Uncharacterized protein n=1 Tax=Candidula unifasciata TaxID=100452 RepID=A0A8S3YJP0_9EUPU|nr:unnamed protein product [Candidula unifasciata]
MKKDHSLTNCNIRSQASVTTTSTTPSHGKSDGVLKIILIGSSGVGKTSLLQRFTDDSFSENGKPTIGVDFEIKTVQVQGRQVTLQMWDTAGQEKFKNVVAPFYRNADGVILVYNITNMDSFSDIQSWFTEVQRYNTRCSLGLLVGNKHDLMFRRVLDPQMAIALANRLGMSYLETSAKHSTNVCELFNAMAEFLLQNRAETEPASPAAGAAADTVNIQPRKQHKSCSQRTCLLA